MAWYQDNSGSTSHRVGQKQPNAWGLADMHGNVEEWCQDQYHDTYFGAPTDGSAWLKGGRKEIRVLRGGAWLTSAFGLRSTYHGSSAPGARINSIGFRLVAVARAQ